MSVGYELDALLRHLVQPPVDEVLFHLEMRNAVAQQAADAIGLLKDCYPVSGAPQLLGSRQPGRTGANHATRLPVRAAAARDDPTFLETASIMLFSICRMVTAAR